MTGRTLSREERDRILELHGQGMPRNEICREVGRSAGAVTNVVQRAGGTFDRAPEVEAATRAVAVDNAARRTLMIQRLYGQAEHVMDRLEHPTAKVVGFDFGKAVVTTVVREAAPAADVRSLSATAVNLLQAAARLEALDTTKGLTAAQSAVDRFFDAVEMAHQGMHDEG